MDPINPQLTDILTQLTLMRENLDAIFLGEEKDKKDKKKTTKELVKVRIDDIKDSALEKIAETLGDISDTTKKGAKGKKDGEEKKEGFFKQIGGALGTFIGEAFGTAASAGGIYGPLLALGIGGGIGLMALGIAGAIKIIAPALPDILDFIKGALPALAKFVSDLLPSVSKFINDVLGGDGFLKFVHTITDFWENVLKDLFAALPVIIMGIGEAIKSVMEGLKSVYEGIGTLLKSLGEGIGAIVKPIVDAIADVYKEVVKTLPVIMAMIPPILVAIKPFFDTLIDFAKFTIDKIISFAKYLIDNLPVIQAFLEPIIDLIKDLAGKYVQYLTVGITALKDAIVALIEMGLNPLIVGLRDVLISLFDNISKIIESVATVIISLGNGIQNILIPVISVLGKTLTGLIDIIKMVVDKGFSLLELSLNTINDIIGNVIGFFETMPKKISDFIGSVVQSVKDLAAVSASDLVKVAGGITAISVALAGLAGGGAISAFTNLFSQDPVKKLQKFIDLKDGLTTTADAIKLLADSLKLLGTDGLGKAIGDNLKSVGEAIKQLGTDGLGKAIGDNLKSVGEAIKQLPVETIKLAGAVSVNPTDAASAASASPTTVPRQDISDILGGIRDTMEEQVTSTVNGNNILTAIAKLIGSIEMPAQSNVVINQPRSTSFAMSDPRSSMFRSSVAGR